MGEHVFEFLVIVRKAPSALENLLHTFSEHHASVEAMEANPDAKAGDLIVTIFSDFSNSDLRPEEMLGEINSSPFVTKAYFEDMNKKMFENYLFPIKIMDGYRVVILRAEPFLSIEKELTRKMGSAGASLMFDEGKTYGRNTAEQFWQVLPPETPMEELLAFIVDGLRATGWGLCRFEKVGDDWDVLVTEPPTLPNGDYQESRFFLGMLAASVESVTGLQLSVGRSEYDGKSKLLTVHLTKTERTNEISSLPSSS